MLRLESSVMPSDFMESQMVGVQFSNLTLRKYGCGCWDLRYGAKRMNSVFSRFSFRCLCANQYCVFLRMSSCLQIFS